MRKYYYFIYPVFIFFYIQIISFYINPVYDIFIDYRYYYAAVQRFWNSEQLYQYNFVYFPSFFFLTPILLNFYIYFLFLLISLAISFILLLKIEENYGMVMFILMLPVLYLYNGNIDPFILMIILICCYYEKDENIPPILLAFISFKPTVILIIPYFLYVSKNRKRFFLLYSSFFILFNLYLIIQYKLFFEFFKYGMFDFGHKIDIIRPYWIYYVYYFGLKEQVKKKSILEGF
ncbi:MAG: hypothetical protein ACTSQJ_08075 [Promethearchaeota archaeon]